MTIDNLDDLLNDDTPLEDVKLDIEQVKVNLPTYSSEKLCEMIVCDRYFGFGQRIDIMCMEELAKRRMAGDAFNFESHIETITKELPEINLTKPDLRDVLTQAIANRLRQK
jgi:hypothetical protein